VRKLQQFAIYVLLKVQKSDVRLLRCVARQFVPEFQDLVHLKSHNPEDEGGMLLRNVGKQLGNHTAQQLRGGE
jgi:hypothetical protein